MTTFNITGKVVHITEAHAVGSSGMLMRDVVVDTAEPSSAWRNPIQFTSKRDKCTLLDGVQVGDQITVRFTVDGRKWDGPNGVRYFTNLTVWGVDILGASEPTPQPEQEDSTLPF